MIHVRVRQQDARDRQLLAFDERQQLVDLVAGIDEHRLRVSARSRRRNRS